MHSATPWLVLAWAAGVAALSLWNFGGWVALQRLKSTSSKIAPAKSATDPTACATSSISAAVRLLTSARIASPMVIGMLKPVILLPASAPVRSLRRAARIDPRPRLADVRRHDYLANLIQSLIETLMFYHPAIWWIGSRIRAERENCCDDIALSLTADRVTYVQALAPVAGRAPGLGPLPPAAFCLPVPAASSASRRPTSPAPPAGSPALVLATALAVGAVLQPLSPTPVAAANPPQTQPSTMTLTVLDRDTAKPIEGVSIGVASGEKIPKNSHQLRWCRHPSTAP